MIKAPKNIIFLDHETTVEWFDSGDTDNSPFNPKNRLVSAHWRTYFDGKLSEPKNAVFFHNEREKPDVPEELISDLEKADLLVAHNLKFDYSWTKAVGLPLPSETYCTMIGEYVLARGQRTSVSLAEAAIRRDLSRKKSDLTHELFKKKIGYEAMPLDAVLEYGDGDVTTLAELYFAQMEDYDHEENRGLVPTRDMMNEMLHFLVDIEENGIFIDQAALNEVEQEFRAEKAEIEARLEEIVKEVMGDTPINLNSGVHMSWVVYSRQLNDKDKHAKMFNIGTDARGKPLFKKKMKNSQFVRAVRANTTVVKRTIAQHCTNCNGSGKYYRTKKNGDLYKSPNNCKVCDSRGFTLLNTGKVAGLKLAPMSSMDATANGFATGKDVLERLIHQAREKDNLLAVEFLEKMRRLNAVSSYLSSFVEGIKRWVRSDGILHTNFNQCTTATGRLSSSKPNFQNLPKGKKFPIRRALRSRWEDGQIMEVDYSGLEFRGAGELSRCPVVIDDIQSGKDVHRQTASIIQQVPVDEIDKDMRQDAKPYTFSPLYGGMGANEPPHIQRYFQEYFKIYHGLAAWQKTLCNTAISTGIVRLPTGREYKFKNVRRLNADRVTNQTNIVNYPVQGFATADIVPIACIRARRLLREKGLKSLAILTVHDSIVFDVYPGEEEAVKAVAVEAMYVHDEMMNRYGYKMLLDLDIEAEIGPNWMETEVTPLPQKCA